MGFGCFSIQSDSSKLWNNFLHLIGGPVSCSLLRSKAYLVVAGLDVTLPMFSLSSNLQ